jgi:amino acid adenylation domain-containing protein
VRHAGTEGRVVSAASGGVVPAPPAEGAGPLAWYESWRARQPEGAALEVGPRTWTYGELDELARSVQAELARHVRPGDIVAVCLDRSPLLVAVAIAVARLDATYLGLGPQPGRERLVAALAAGGAGCVVTDGEVETPPGWSSAALPGVTLLLSDRGVAQPVLPARPFYVVLTSGSTGAPKAVAVGLPSFANLLRWHCAACRLGPASRLSMMVGVAFDAHPLEMWAALSAGACLCPVPDGLRTSPAGLLGWLREGRVTVAHVPTPLAELTFDLDWPSDLALEYVVMGGDRLRRRPPALARPRFHNMYGPAETTCTATAHLLEPAAGGPVPIGRPISGVEVSVVDAGGRPVPVGEPGELWVGGAALALGYLDPALTAERFLDRPEGRVYRTGDRVRMDEEGVLEFLGRVDDQVKVRGARIEPAEVEAALERLPGVARAVVLPVGAGGDVRLAAFVRPAAPGAARPLALLEALRASLPEQAVPSAVHLVDELPLTANGKVDRAELAARALDGAAQAATVEAVLSGHERVRRVAVEVRAAHVTAFMVANGRPPGSPAVREWLAERVPRATLPGRFVWLPAMPLTAAGEIDRRRLPEVVDGGGPCT